LYPRRTIPERCIDAGLPQIGWFEYVRVGRENQGQHRLLLSHLIGGITFVHLTNGTRDQRSLPDDDVIGQAGGRKARTRRSG
jgi:hypothetical protein